MERLGYESPRIDNESVLSTSYLTSLNVQLNASGVITVTPHTVSQDGITRLCSPQDDIADLLQVPSGADLWLCPNGAIARLVTANTESPTVPSPGYPTSGNAVNKRKQWKQEVVQWLANWGMPIESIGDEPWVEVEVWEPFFARLAGEAWRQGDESQSSLPLKRMLWPARFCFKRCDVPKQSSWLQQSLDDPLEFAARCTFENNFPKLEREARNTPGLQEASLEDHGMLSPRVDNMETFESLSRMAQYPDLQTTNLVYPTPPDGAAASAANHANPSAAFVEDTDFNLSPAAAQDLKSLANPEFSPDVAVGSGRYDASDDDDLFGEMNERDFGAKGITDADFSFFDDPTIDNINGDEPTVPTQETPHGLFNDHSLEKEQPGDTAMPDIKPTQTLNPAEDTKDDEALILQEQPEADDPAMGDDLVQPFLDSQSQPISPPLSPVEIQKILFASSRTGDEPRLKGSRAQQGHYHPVTFERRIGDWDQKYGATGKFWFSAGGAPEASEQTAGTIPTIGLPHRGRPAAGQGRAAGRHASRLAVEDQAGSSSISSDSGSEELDELPLEHATAPIALSSLKRKRVPSDADIQSAVSPAKSSGGPGGSLGTKTENSTFLGNFLASFSDWTLTGYFSAPQIQQLPVLLRREDQIQVAQLLVDQISQSSLNHVLGVQVGLCGLECEPLALRTHLSDADFPGDVSRLDLKSYTFLQEDMTAIATQQPSKDSSRSSISKVPAPHLRVRRGKQYLEALPPAVSFWKTFGLEPAHGAKDISAYCIHPRSAREAADAFLDRFELAYESCSLGGHKRGDLSTTFERGLRTWDAELSSYASMMHSLKGLCGELGRSPCAISGILSHVIKDLICRDLRPLRITVSSISSIRFLMQQRLGTSARLSGTSSCSWLPTATTDNRGGTMTSCFKSSR